MVRGGKLAFMEADARMTLAGLQISKILCMRTSYDLGSIPIRRRSVRGKKGKSRGLERRRGEVTGVKTVKKGRGRGVIRNSNTNGMMVRFSIRGNNSGKG
jgi:hypothetical protein